MDAIAGTYHHLVSGGCGSTHAELMIEPPRNGQTVYPFNLTYHLRWMGRKEREAELRGHIFVKSPKHGEALVEFARVCGKELPINEYETRVSLHIFLVESGTRSDLETGLTEWYGADGRWNRFNDLMILQSCRDILRLGGTALEFEKQFPVVATYLTKPEMILPMCDMMFCFTSPLAMSAGVIDKLTQCISRHQKFNFDTIEHEPFAADVVTIVNYFQTSMIRPDDDPICVFGREKTLVEVIARRTFNDECEFAACDDAGVHAAASSERWEIAEDMTKLPEVVIMMHGRVLGKVITYVKDAKKMGNIGIRLV